MPKQFHGEIRMDVRNSKPDWAPYEPPRSPEGTPNVLMIVWDDVGFGALSPYGGLIETPTMDRLAANGIRYTQWHTTALCSPTRSCLLTGRNCHLNGMATVVEAAKGYPNSNGHIPFENGFISEILADQGFSTYAVGKWHLTPDEENNMAATKRGWPLARGFERFYGFMGGETNQWYPVLIYDQHPIEQPARPEQGYHLSADLADRAIQFIRDSKVVAPEKPFFMYFCPGAGHAPHHVFEDWADKYKGKFDMGYEKYREVVLENQKQLGIVPQNTEIPPINPLGTPDSTHLPMLDYTRPWDSLSEDEKTLFRRMAEVYAGFISYTDAQIGRLIDYLEESGQIDNTIIIALSDNGASAEGGPNGSVNENLFFNGVPDDPQRNLQMLDALGSPKTYNHYPNGWAMAFNTPFKMWKRYSWNGGVCDPFIISWPRGIKAKNELRHQYHHAIDVMPTILDCLGIASPDTIKGVTQSPIQGLSMRYSFDDNAAPTTKLYQYYEMLGSRGIWFDGWKANTTHAALGNQGHFEDDVWELYRTAEDRSEVHNLADEHPDIVRRLEALWWHEAGVNHIFPLDDRPAVEIITEPRPQVGKPRDRYVYYPDAAGVPESAAFNARNRSFSIVTEVDITTPEASGVLFADGSRFGGQALYIKNGRLNYIYNLLGITIQHFTSDEEIPTGKIRLTAEFQKTGEQPKGVANGALRLFINDKKVAEETMKTQPGPFSPVGHGLAVGRDDGEPVTDDYPGDAPWAFTGGTIKQVIVTVSGAPHVDVEQRARAALGRS